MSEAPTVPRPPSLLEAFGRMAMGRAKAAVGPVNSIYGDPSIDRYGGGWFRIVGESFTGAWQRNIETRIENLVGHSAVYACITLIASDIAKMALCLVAETEEGIWTEVENPAYSPVLRRPNGFQNRIQFIQWWVTCKLSQGATYVLKERDGSQKVRSLYILDPLRTKPLVLPDGSVWYRTATDPLSGVTEKEVYIPASEIIHDVMNPLFHPLYGVTPISACALAAGQGLAIQRNSARFFANMSRPSGVLTSEQEIDEDLAGRFKKAWDENFQGDNLGKIAVLGKGLTYAAMGVNAQDSQLIEQLKWSAETVCSAFHVPPYMIGVGPAPSYNNIEALNQQYYSQCLQVLIESIELLLDEGLSLDRKTGVQFDLDGLLRMDSATQVKTLTEGLKGIYASNEARRKLNLPPVDGGDAVLSQQQNYSLEALAKRDAREDPFAKADAPAAAAPEPEPANDDDEEPNEAQGAKALLEIVRGLADVGR